MAHDGQHPSTQTGPFSEEVAKAQRSLAGVLHQVESPLPIVSELAGVTTKNRKQGPPNRPQTSFPAAFLAVQSPPAEGASFEVEAPTRMK